MRLPIEEAGQGRAGVGLGGAAEGCVGISWKKGAEAAFEKFGGRSSVRCQDWWLEPESGRN